MVCILLYAKAAKFSQVCKVAVPPFCRHVVLTSTFYPETSRVRHYTYYSIFNVSLPSFHVCSFTIALPHPHPLADLLCARGLPRQTQTGGCGKTHASNWPTILRLLPRKSHLVYFSRLLGEGGGQSCKCVDFIE